MLNGMRAHNSRRAPITVKESCITIISVTPTNLKCVLMTHWAKNTRRLRRWKVQQSLAQAHAQRKAIFKDRPDLLRLSQQIPLWMISKPEVLVFPSNIWPLPLQTPFPYNITEILMMQSVFVTVIFSAPLLWPQCDKWAVLTVSSAHSLS